jgi:hypothetical protein
MSERYCPKCETEVEDVGGFCLLGHSLKLRALTDTSLGDLRAEVDKAFEEARMQVAAITGEIPVVDADASAPPPPPPLPDDLEEQTKTRMEELWADFEEEPQSPADPITQFAPNTRMDWGPGEASQKRRGFRRS